MTRCKFNSELNCAVPDCLNCDYKQNMLIGKYIPNFIEKYFLEEAINQNTICPFCLYADRLSKFFQKDSKMCKCPDCQNTMYIDTLKRVVKLNATQFGEFVYKYPFYDFFKKCKFEVFNRRLNMLGISREFWDSYHNWRGKE